MKNEVIVESTKDKIRKSPEIIFDYKDIRGVENAFRSMLEIFTAEALRGHGNEIEVFRFNDSIYAIRLRSDRCLNLGKIGCGDEAWRKLFTEFCTDFAEFMTAADYNRLRDTCTAIIGKSVPALFLGRREISES